MREVCHTQKYGVLPNMRDDYYHNVLNKREYGVEDMRGK
jgi:hypothetical protein